MKKAISIAALVLVGYGFGVASAPAKVAAGSVDNIVNELQQLRQAAQDISRKLDCR